MQVVIPGAKTTRPGMDKNTVETLRDELEISQKRIGTLDQRIAEMTVEMDKLRAQVTEKDAYLQNALRRVREKDGVIEDLRDTLETFKRDRENSVNYLQVRIQDLNEELIAARTDLRESESQRGDAEHRLASVMQANEALQDRTNEAEKIAAQFRASFEEASACVVTLTNEKAEMAEELRKAISAMDVANDALDNSEARLENLSKKYRALQERTKKMEGEVDELISQADSAKSLAEINGATGLKVTQKYHEATHRLRQMEETVAKVKARLEEALKSVDIMTVTIDQQKVVIQRQEGVIRDLNQQLKEYRDHCVAEDRHTAEELQKRLEEERQRNDIYNDKLHHDNHDLSQRLSIMNNQYERLREENARLRVLTEELEKDLAQERESLRELQQRKADEAPPPEILNTPWGDMTIDATGMTQLLDKACEFFHKYMHFAKKAEAAQCKIDRIRNLLSIVDGFAEGKKRGDSH